MPLSMEQISNYINGVAFSVRVDSIVYCFREPINDKIKNCIQLDLNRLRGKKTPGNL